jgi:hypothetical protein
MFLLNRLKSLDNEENAQVLERVGHFGAVSLHQFEGPLLDVDDSVAQSIEAQVVVLFLESVYRVFREFRLHIVESVAQHYHRDIFVNEQSERLDRLLRECVFEVAARLHEQL